MRNYLIASGLVVAVAASVASCGGAGAQECEKAAFDAYCAGVTIGLSKGAEETSPDLSTGLRSKSAEFMTAYQQEGYPTITQKYLQAGVEDASRSADTKVMKSLLGLCVTDDERARTSFGKRVASECSQASKE